MQQPHTKKSVKKNWISRVTVNCTLFLFSILYTVNGFANVYNVTDVTDGHATNQLRGAIEEADALGGTHTINVAAGTYVLTLGQIIFGNTAQNITIIGAGPGLTIISMLEGATQDRIFFINPTGGTNSPVISIQGIKFENGYLNSDPYGGAAICAGGGEAESLTVTNCIFENNILPAGAYGGAAICMQVRGDLSIDNCTFTNNVSNDVDGGAVFFVVYNSGLGNGFGTLSVTNSTFTNNAVVYPGTPASNGGAISFTGQDGVTPFNVTITENTFLNNTADGSGGAIAADNAPAVSTSQVNYNRFVGNTSGNTAAGALAMNSSPGSVNATNNWWGCNGGPLSASGCDRAAVVGSGGAGSLTTAPYLQLKASASPSSICSGSPNNTTTVTASFLSNSAGSAIAASDLGALVGVPVSFTATLGTLSAAQPTIQSGGTATVTFTSNGTAGTATVNAVVDNVPDNDPVAKASIAVNGSPAIGNQPDNTSVCSGETASFAVIASGASLTYQWYRGATPLSDGPSGSGSTYAGTTTPLFNISNTSAADNAADYNVHVSNLCGTVISNNASLTVNPIPVVTNPAVTTGTVGFPFSQTFTQTGGSAGTTFTTTSTLPNGLNLSSAGVLSGTPTQTGTFPITVKATDVTGCFGTGPVYNLVIDECPPVTVNPVANQTVCNNATTAAVNFSGSPAGVVFNWTNNTPSIGLAASGAGNIAPFTATNATNATVTATITVTPVYTFGNATCTGNAITFTISVTPSVTGGDITMSPNPTVAGEQPNTIFLGYGPQTVTLTASAAGGGTPPYTAVWSTGSTAASIIVSPVVTTTYTYTITDALGCTRTTSFTVTVLDYRCGNNNNKVTICHNGHTICVNPEAVDEHLNHGDLLGPCPPAGMVSTNTEEIKNPGVKNAETFKVTVAPNPSSNGFIIQVAGNSQETIQVRITDISGRICLAGSMPGGSVLRTGNNLTGGIYFAEVVQGKNRQVVKLVKLD